MFVVSDEVLERLVCSECKKYLSQKPIKVYHSRNIKCGRCSDPFDGGVVSLFGVLAEEALFRCVNRFDGCNQFLTYSDVAEHEKTCVAKQYECPACTSPFKGSTYDIFNHFKQEHEDAFLMNFPEFTVSIEKEQYKCYLHCKNDLLFFITVFYNTSELELCINICHMGSDQNSSQISQKFTLYSFDRKIRYKSKSKSCCSVSGGHLKMFKVSISPDDFPNDIVICRFTLDTENVESLVAMPNDFKKSNPISSKGLSCTPLEKSQFTLDTENVESLVALPNDIKESNPISSKGLSCTSLEKSSSPPVSEVRKYPVETYRPNFNIAFHQYSTGTPPNELVRSTLPPYTVVPEPYTYQRVYEEPKGIGQARPRFAAPPIVRSDTSTPVYKNPAFPTDRSFVPAYRRLSKYPQPGPRRNPE